MKLKPERPKTVTLAVVLLAVSLAYRIYGELALLSFLYPDPMEYGHSFFGWALLLASIYVFQAWVIWKVAQGRNWARIVTILIVLLRVGMAVFILAGPFGPIVGSPLIAIAHVSAEVIAALLLLSASRFFRPSQSAL